MRKYLLILLTAITFVACSKNENTEISDDYYTRHHILVPAEKLETPTCYAMDDEDLRLLITAPRYFDAKYVLQNKYSHYQETYDSIERTIQHIPLDFNNMRILFLTRTSSKPLESWTTEKEKQGLYRFHEFDKLVAGKVFPTGNAMMEKYPQLEKSHFLMYPAFFTVRISGNVSVKADRMLFGQEAGADLSEHFVVESPSPCLPKGTFEDFGFLFWYDTEVSPKALQEYFADGTWFQRVYAFRLRDLPEENPEEVTFTVSIPITCEYWREFYMHGLPEVRTENRTLSASCTFHFGKISDFESNYSRYKAENDQLAWW